MVGLIDLAALQQAAAWVSVAAALGGLLNLSLGLISLRTGRDLWPERLNRLRWRKPATQEDARRNGMALVLNGAAILMIILGVSLNMFAIGDRSLGEPLITLRFVISMIGLVGAMACVAAAYGISLTVKYVNPRFPAEAPPAET